MPKPRIENPMKTIENNIKHQKIRQDTAKASKQLTNKVKKFNCQHELRISKGQFQLKRTMQIKR